MQHTLGSTSGIPTVVKNLLIVNGLMFLLKLVHPLHMSGDQLDTLLGLHFFASPLFKPWQLVTHMFMHGGIWHIALNMFALFMLGPQVEYRWGSKRFFTYYMLCGLGAAFIYMGWQWFLNNEALSALSSADLADVRAQVLRAAAGYEPVLHSEAASSAYDLFTQPMVGASGAIFGVLLAFGMLFPNVELTTFIYFFPIRMKAKWFVLLYGGFELYSGVANNPGDNTAHFAHIGGMAVGWFLVKHYERKLSQQHFY